MTEFNTGDIVRYNTGPTALARIHSTHALGYHADQCMGGTVFISEQLFKPWVLADYEDLRTWRRCAHWRREGPHPDYLPYIFKKNGRYRWQAQREPRTDTMFYGFIQQCRVLATDYCERMNSA